jgi:hypothetical protein
MSNSLEFDAVLDEMRELRSRKNEDYGDGFYKAYDEFGFAGIAMDLGRKYDRIKTFAKKKVLLVSDETVEDTLKDLAIMSINALLWFRTPSKKPSLIQAATSCQGELEYFKERACCDPANRWGHTASCPREQIKSAVDAIKLAYRKHHLGDESVGWEELSDFLHNTMCNILGDEEYNEWVEETRRKE